MAPRRRVGVGAAVLALPVAAAVVLAAWSASVGWPAAASPGAPAAASPAAASPGAAAAPSAGRDRAQSDPRAFTVYHYDLAGTGAVPAIKAVDTSTPTWTSPALDGQLYGEPLVAAGRVYVATENDTVYALSARTGAVVWSRHLASPVPAAALPCGDISPSVGITGTPVLDSTRNEIFVVADEDVAGRPAHRLVGLGLATGRVELSEDVDPPGSDPAALLQRTGLTLEGGRVVFGYGGNAGDCSTYHGWVVGVPEGGGAPVRFEVDSGPGDDQGAIWMGGAAPAVDGYGDVWVEAGNGSVHSPLQPYDESDSVLELSPSLGLLQYFAPTTWASDNADDLDMSMEPVLLSDGEVVAAGKSRIAYLLRRPHLGGIGGQQAELGSLCSGAIDGGGAVVGTTVYLPCRSGPVAVQVTASPASIRLLWSSGSGGGPPVVAAGLVWTIGQNGELYGLDASTGRVRQQAAIGSPANHFPTPSLGDGLLLAPSAYRVVAFRAMLSSTPATTTTLTVTSTTSPASTTSAAGAVRSTARHGSRGKSLPTGVVALIVIAGVAAGAGLAWALGRRQRAGGAGGPAAPRSGSA